MNLRTFTLTFTLTLTAYSAPPERFWGALHQVETGGALGATLGDNGKALGPLQIHRAYHADSRVGNAGDYARCADLAYSRRVVSAYLQRYAKAAWDKGDRNSCDLLARVHNGGPNALRATGQKKRNLDRYAAKVMSHLP
jgi:hypothetical protein